MERGKEAFHLDGRTLYLTHLDKPLWPKGGGTKRDLLAYLLSIASTMLPHLSGRLITLIRYPDGVEGKSFYQKNRPPYTPDWIPSHRFQHTDYLLLQERAALLYCGNLGAIEIHTSFHRIPDIKPEELVFDLDPSVEGFARVAEAALLIKEELDALHLPSLVKTSGATGLQIYVPLQKGHTFEQTRRFASFFARYMVEKRADLFTIERSIRNRGTKIYFDYLQHWKGKSIIAPYSPRARISPAVSTPLRWEELPHVTPEDFTIRQVPNRIKAVGDLFSPLLTGEGANLTPFLDEIAHIYR